MKGNFINDYFKAVKAFQPIIQKIEKEIEKHRKRDALIDEACLKISVENGIPLEMVRADAAIYKQGLCLKSRFCPKQVLNAIEVKSSQPPRPSPSPKL